MKHNKVKMSESPLRYYDLLDAVCKDLEIMNKEQLEAVTEVLLRISQYCEKKHFVEQALETKPLVKTLEEISENSLDIYIHKFPPPKAVDQSQVSKGVDYII